MSFAATDPTYCRLTVLGPRIRVDVALPADLPVAELVPMVLELVGEPVFGVRPQPWRLFRVTGAPLPLGESLHELGVLEGDLLRIAPDRRPPPAPVFDDPVDALAATARPATHGRLPAAAILLLGAAAALLLAGGPAALAPPGPTAGPAPVLVATLAGAAALAGAAWSARQRLTPPGRAPDSDDHPAGGDPPDRSRTGTGPPASEPLDTDDENRARDRHPASVHNDHAARCAALVAALLAAAAGWAVLPDAAVPVRLLVAAAGAGGAAALGLLAVRRPAPALVGVIVTAVPVGAAACAVLRLPVPATSAAVGVSAVALVAGPLLPRAALWLSAMPRPAVPADAAELVTADDGPDLLPAAELVERAELARGYLAGLVGGSALLAGAAALPAAALPGWTGPAFAAVAVTVLGLRARNFVDPAPARALAASALLTGVGLAGILASTSAALARPVAALGLLLAAAAFLGAAGRDHHPLGSPVRRRAVDLVEALLTAAVVPLAFGAMGLYATLRGL
jgi:hypothetical protein